MSNFPTPTDRARADYCRDRSSSNLCVPSYETDLIRHRNRKNGSETRRNATKLIFQWRRFAN
jgi:hypothetical protein